MAVAFGGGVGVDGWDRGRAVSGGSGWAKRGLTGVGVEFFLIFYY